MSEDKIWYIALNDEQVGPLSQDEVRAEIEAGQVTGSTYIWRDGLEDWVMAADVDEFADAVSADEPDIADVAGESVDAFFASYDSSASDDNDAAAASVAAASVGGEKSDGPSGLAASTVATRSDDSVLFSLDELAATTQRVAEPDTSTTDGSGLIDLSALASTASTMGPATTRATAQTSSTESVSSQPAVAAVALAPPKKSVLPFVLLGIAAVAIIGLLVAIFLLLGKKDEAPPVAEAPATDAVAEDTSAEKPEEKAEAADDTAAAADADAEDAEADAPEEPEAPEAPAAAAPKATGSSAKKPSSSSSSASAPKADSKPAAKPSSPAPSSSSASKPSSSSSSKSSGSGGGDSVSAALASISGDSSSSKSSGASSGGGATLSDTQIRNTVRRYNGKVQNCKSSDADAGTYRVAFAINNDGSTSQVTAREGGAAAACVADVVKTMRFPAFDGPERKLTYTFAIR